MSLTAAALLGRIFERSAESAQGINIKPTITFKEVHTATKKFGF